MSFSLLISVVVLTFKYYYSTKYLSLVVFEEIFLTMAAYIDDYLTLHKPLSGTTIQSLENVQKCDISYHKLGLSLKKLLTKYQKGGVLSEKEIQHVNMLKKQMEKLCDLKITLSTKLYDLVDEHMKTGCSQLKSLERAEAAKRKTISAGDGNNSDEGEFRKRRVGRRGNRHDEVLNQSHLNQRLKVDDSEPLYCTCRQVAYGDMIACENDSCPIEWFHYKCVGLTKPPRKSWYCQSCLKNMNK